MYLSHHFIQALEPHGEVVVVIQVSQALLMLPLIVPVVTAPPDVAVAVSAPQISITASSQYTCTTQYMSGSKQLKLCVYTDTDHRVTLLLLLLLL